jgi:hypothetical protein
MEHGTRRGQSGSGDDSTPSGLHLGGMDGVLSLPSEAAYHSSYRPELVGGDHRNGTIYLPGWI